MLPRTIFCLLATLVATTAHAGKVFRWADADGNIHYSDRPQDKKAEVVRLAPPPSDTGSTQGAASPQDTLKVWQDERAKKNELKAEAKAAEDKRKADCAAAKARLTALTNARYLYNPGEDGERQVLSFEERAEKEKEAQEAVKKACK